MPRKRYSKKRNYRKKRKYTKKRGNNNAVSSYKQTSPIGRTFKTKLRYVETHQILTPGPGTLDDTSYRANGMFDPRGAIGGHQPYGFDQLTPLYDHWTVIASRAHVTFTNESTEPQVCLITVRDNGTALTNKDDALEGSNVKYITLTPAGGSRDIGTITYNLNPNKFLGISKPMASSILRGTAIADPAEQAYFHVCCAPATNIEQGSVSANIMIEYTAIFSEPKAVGGS